MPDPTRAPAFATPVFICPAIGALTKNYPGAAAANEIYDGAGFVSAIYVNTLAANSTIELFDGNPGAGGVSIGKWPTTAIISIPLGIPFADSLWATVTNAPNVTVTYVPSA